jgi:hypothetical protein
MATLEDFIMKMRQLGELPDAVASAAAPALEQAARANVAAGLDPYGKQWPPKKDGSRALKDADKAVHVTSAGPTCTITVEGVEAFHNGLKEGGAHPRRQLIPESGDPIPDYLTKALDAVAAKVVGERLGAK